MASSALDASARDQARRHSETIAFVVLCALLLAAPWVFYPVFVMQALCFALFACAFNLLIGYVGLLSFGHAMFLGFAAYICAHMAKLGVIDFPVKLGPLNFGRVHWDFGPLPPELAILCGVLGSLVIGFVVGALAIRRQGIYFAMITLAFAQMVYFFCLQAPFTHGEDGIQGVPQGKMFALFALSNQLTLYYVVAAIFLAGFLFIHRVINSPFGDVLKAIRENEPRAVSLGYKVERYKLMAFVLSAGLAGLAGATKAIVMQNAALTDVKWSISGEVVLMTLLGGMGTIFGPIVGAVLIIFMQSYLSEQGQIMMILQGIIFVFCVMAFRRGILGELAYRFNKSL